MEFYCIPDFADVQEFLSHIARRHGRLKKGGLPDVDAAAKVVLHDWNRWGVGGGRRGGGKMEEERRGEMEGKGERVRMI